MSISSIVPKGMLGPQTLTISPSCASQSALTTSRTSRRKPLVQRSTARPSPEARGHSSPTRTICRARSLSAPQIEADAEEAAAGDAVVLWVRCTRSLHPLKRCFHCWHEMDVGRLGRIRHVSQRVTVRCSNHWSLRHVDETPKANGMKPFHGRSDRLTAPLTASHVHVAHLLSLIHISEPTRRS
eukprot:307800-Prymnesium_polylepis.1